MKKCFFKNAVDNALSIPDDKKISENSFKIRMAMSFIGIIACMTLMLSSAFALFYDDVRPDNSVITGAYFAVSVTNAPNGEYVCPLASGDSHTFVITAEGTASAGYCMITVGTDKYYTPRLTPGSSFEVEIIAVSGTSIRFEGRWGTPSGAEGTLCNNRIEHSSTEFATYTVENGATLEALSAYYNVAADDILTFNGISELAVGAEIKIPNVASGTAPFVVAPADNTEPSAEEPADTTENDEQQGEDTQAQDQQQSDPASDTENEDEQPDSVE